MIATVSDVLLLAIITEKLLTRTKPQRSRSFVVFFAVLVAVVGHHDERKLTVREK